jgi:small subunit ribosomal protein S6
MVKQYETTFILDAHLPNEQIEASVGKYSQLIEKNSGKILSVERWGKRRLSYEIKKKQYGFYVYIRFESDGKLCLELERVYKLDDSVLRHLTLLVSKQALQDEARKKAEAKSKAEAAEPKPEPVVVPENVQAPADPS